MSQRLVLSFKRLQTGSSASSKEREQALPSPNAPDLSPANMNIISKLNNVISELKALEEKFSSMRDNLLKKNTLEGRESTKICAVQAKVILSQKKHNKDLDQDIEALSFTFQEQVQKINKEIGVISSLSKSRVPIRTGSSGEILLSCFSPKYSSNLPAIEVIKSSEIKSSSIMKVKSQVGLTLKTGKSLPGKPHVFNFEASEVLEYKRPQASHFAKVNLQKGKEETNENKESVLFEESIDSNGEKCEEDAVKLESALLSRSEVDVEQETYFKF